MFEMLSLSMLTGSIRGANLLDGETQATRTFIQSSTGPLGTGISFL